MDLTPKLKSRSGSGWFSDLKERGAALAARAQAATSSAAKRVSEAAASFSARGSTARAQPIDESSPDWRIRAGRASGPDTYVHGDLCAATFRRALALSPRERELLYCGAVLLVGVLEADGLRAPEKGGLPSPYASLSLEDNLGYDVRAEHQLTRTIPGTLAPQWDEVFAVGQRVESLDDVARVRLTVKSYGGALSGMGGNEKLGMAHLRLDELMETEAAGGAWTERWVPLQADAGTGSSAAGSGDGGGSDSMGRLRIFYLFHRPPSTPQPVSVGAVAVCAHALSGGDGHAHYVTVAALNKLRGRVRGGDDAPMRPLRGTLVRDGGAAPSFSDAFELHDITFGGVSGDVAGGSAGPWGWAGGMPRALLAAATVRPIEVALADSATELQVGVWEEGVALNACVGEVSVPFASLWGHEDAVAHGSTLRIARWYRLSPPRGLLEGVTGGGGGGGGGGGTKRAPGRLFLDIVLRFSNPLLPAGWVESVCAESGDAYFYNETLRLAQWEPPAWPADSEGEGGGGGGASARERGASAATAAALLRDGARTRGASAAWAAEGGVMGASAAATGDVVSGDSPHKPPRPRVLREGAVSSSGSAEARVRALGSLGGAPSPRDAATAAGGDGGGGSGGWPRPPPPAEPAAKLTVNPFNMKISPLAGGQKRWGIGGGSGGFLSGGATSPSGPLPTLSEVPSYLSSAGAGARAPAGEAAKPSARQAAGPAPANTAGGGSPPPSAAVAAATDERQAQAASAPPPAAARTPAPAKQRKAGGGGGGGGGEEGDEDEEEGGGDAGGAPPSGPSEADLEAAAAGGSKGAAARAEAALLAVPEFNNPLAGMPRPAGGAGGHREGDFFKALAKNAAEKKAAQEAEKAVRLRGGGLLAPSCRACAQY
jgi:hypothetical protein